MTSGGAQRKPLYTVGDILVLPFPGSTGDAPKRRPAVVLAIAPYGTRADYIVGLITSQAAPDPNRLILTPADIQDGFLSVQSYLRPAYLYTASEAVVLRRIGTLAPTRLAEAIQTLVDLLQPPPTVGTIPTQKTS